MEALPLKTKLYVPPVRPELVLRPRLIEQLNAGLHGRLILVSAPAGFGKTTLVNAWLRAADRPVAWISLDEEDNDPIRFLNYLVAAFRQVDDGVGQAVQHLLDAPQLASEALLTELINAVVTRSLSFVLVLDDYHTITALDVHQAVGFLLERLPPQVLVVILSRQDPPLPLSRLRGHGQVTEIRQGDLRFTLEETTTFLNQLMGLGLEPSQIAALDTHTEGWIAGLQMAAVALQSRIAEGRTNGVAQFIDRFSGRYHFILDYLTDEVLGHQPEPIYRFLLRTSILERMCSSLCDALADPAAEDAGSSQRILKHLDQANLFVVPLDDERRWYRYHRLFADLLRVRLQEVAPEQESGLHLRAARWYAQNALPVEAVHHALAVPDYDLAADVIEHAVARVTTWSSINVATFLEWLKPLPDDVLHARPRLRLFTSRVLYMAGRREEARRILQEIEESLRSTPPTPEIESLLGLIAADRASYAAVRGEVQQTIALAHEALTYQSEHGAMARMRVSAILGLAHFRAGHVAEAARAFSEAIAAAKAADLGYVVVPFMCNLAEVQIVQGRLRQALQTCQQAMETATVEDVPGSTAGFIGLEMAQVLCQQNDLSAAERHALEGLGLLRQSGTTDSFGIGHAILARIQQAQGRDDEALAAIERAVRIAQEFGIARVSILIAAHQARIWLAQGRLDLAAQWARDYEKIGETEYLREFEDLTLARVLLAQGESSAALALLDTLLPPAEAAGRMGTVVTICTLRALALLALGDEDTALEALRRALQLAEPEGNARVFIDAGEPMARLLREAANRGLTPDFVDRLLAVSGAEMDRPAGDVSPLVEPLSTREKEVLALLAEGLSNREIGQRLFIALPTVKSHTRNVYGKLGVHSRREAVVRARALGILPSR